MEWNGGMKYGMEWNGGMKYGVEWNGEMKHGVEWNGHCTQKPAHVASTVQARLTYLLCL